MVKISLFLFLQAITICSAADIFTGSTTVSGVSIFWSTRLEPPSPELGELRAQSGDGDTTICDATQKICFGFHLAVTPLKDGQVELTFSATTLTPEKMGALARGKNGEKITGWKFLPLPKRSATQIARVGDTVAIDLFINPSTGQKIVEYVIAGRN